MSEMIPFGPVAPSAKPKFDPPDGFRYQTDGIQMQLSWRPDFGAEKTAALQKAQYALAQEAAKLIDSYVPFATGTLKNSVNLASKYDEGLLVYDAPYARKQYYLHEQGTCLHGETGLRGSYWGQRALADVGEHLALYGARAVTTFWDTYERETHHCRPAGVAQELPAHRGGAGSYRGRVPHCGTG